MKKRPLCLACIGLMAVILLLKLSGSPFLGEPDLPPAARTAVQEKQDVYVSGQIFKREKKANSFRYYLKQTLLFIQEQEIPLGNIYITARTEKKYPVGGTVLVSGTLEQPEQAGNPGQFDARSYYACQKIFYSVWAEEIRLLKEPDGTMGEAMARLQETLSEKTASILPKDQAGILAAMLWGDKSLLEEETKIDYQYGGVSHILSISGLHVTLLGMAVYRLIRRLLPWEIPAAVAGAACMLWYSLFTGAQTATMRAFIMFAVSLGARLTGRSYDTLCSLALAGILLLLENPGMLFSSGFQLSFTAVLGISLACPAVLSLLPAPAKKAGKIRRTGRKLLESACSCGVIWCVTLPLTAYYFYELPLWSTLVNLLMLPFMGALMILGLAGAGLALFWPGAGAVLLFPAGMLLGIFEGLMKLLRQLPGGLLICGQPAPWQTALCYGGIALAVFWCGRRKRGGAEGRTVGGKWMLAAALGLICVIFPRHGDRFSLTVLDVGQGDCLALQAGDWSFLVDGGSSSESQVGKYRILPYLKQQGIRRLEGIFLTHPDQDHMNGIRELLEAQAARETQLTVRTLFLPSWMRETEEDRELSGLAAAGGTRVRYLQAGDEIRAGGCRIEVLYPEQGLFPEEGEENGASLVLGLHYGTAGFLLTGDLEGEGEEKLLEKLGSYAYLKVAHHGSRNSTGEAFLDRVRPALCVISAPEHSIYGHPHEEVLERIRQAGGTVFCTAGCGAVRAVSDGEKIEVFTFLDEYDIL